MIIRRFTALLLIFFLLFNVTISADAALSDNKILDLKAFSILEGDANGDLRLDEHITRAEFTKAVCRLLNFSDDASLTGEKFKDVAADYWAFRFIAITSSLGLINGDESGNFYPENNITYNQAAKILVSALGFKEEANKAGGYPSGYVAYANDLGLLKSVSYGSDEDITRGDVFLMLYNCLDADRLVVESYGNEKKIGLADKTLREILLENKDQDLIKFRGIVTANYKTYLADPITDMKTDEVEVGGRIFSKGQTNADEYLGMEVDVYIAKESEYSGRYIIKEIKPTENNSSVDILFEDIAKITKNEIRYISKDSNNTKRESLTVAQFVYNGRVISDVSDLDVYGMQDGKVTLLSNHDKDTVNFVFIDQYESFVVDRVVGDNADDVNIFFANNKTLRGSRNILLGKDHDVTYEIYDKDKKPATYEAIHKGDLISVFYSPDKELAKIMISDKVSEGVLSSFSNEEYLMFIDDQEYSYEKGLDVSGYLGEDITVKVNFEGKVSYIDRLVKNSNYGGIVKIKQGRKLNNPYQVMLVIPDLLSDEVEELDNEDEYANNEIPAISGKNLKTQSLSLGKSVTYNGTKYSAEEAIAAIQDQMTLNNADFLAVSYGLDANGDIKKIDLPKIYKQGNDRTYNAYEKTFSDGKNNPNAPTVFGAFGLGDKTVAICVPDNGTDPVERDDYLAKVEMNNGQEYYVEAYEFNKTTNCPDFIMIHAPMVYETAGITDGKSKLALVNNTSFVLNEENEQVRKIQLITQDGTKDVYVSNDTTSTSDFNSIGVGDLIRYSLNARDELDGFEILQSTVPTPNTYYSNGNQDKVIFVGNITDVNYDQVSPGLNKWVHMVEIKDAYGNKIEYQISKKSGPPIFVFSSSKKTGRLGTIDDLAVTHKRAVIYSSGLLRGVTNVKAIVIII